MKKVRKKCGCTILAVLLALLPVQVAADGPASLSSAAEACFIKVPLTRKNLLFSKWIHCFSLQMTAVLTEYIILFLLKQSKKACHYPWYDCDRTRKELLKNFPI